MFFYFFFFFFFKQKTAYEIRDVTGVQTCALPIWLSKKRWNSIAPTPFHLPRATTKKSRSSCETIREPTARAPSAAPEAGALPNSINRETLSFTQIGRASCRERRECTLVAVARIER